MTYRELALRTGLKEVGVTEHPAGSNSGARVQEYQASTSLGGTGWPWCAAFVCWCFMKAGKPLVSLDRSASVAQLLGKARQLGLTVAPASYARGDIVCYDWNDLDGPNHGDMPDHVGIVLERIDATHFKALEGNTAVGNDSNGGAVMIRDRVLANVEGFIRVPGTLPTPKPYYFELVALDPSRPGELIVVDHSVRCTKAGLAARALAFTTRVTPKIAKLAAAGRKPRVVKRTVA